jgi:hypothetical protein
LMSGVANSTTANNATLMDAITNNVRAVCQSPSDQGKHWSVKAKGDGSVTIGLKFAKLANLNTNGEAEFTKEEWEGVQQVLKEQQSDDNKDYRACARELTPKFLEKFNPDSESSKGEADSVSQSSSGPNSPNVNNIKGNINFNY